MTGNNDGLWPKKCHVWKVSEVTTQEGRKDVEVGTLLQGIYKKNNAIANNS